MSEVKQIESTSAASASSNADASASSNSSSFFPNSCDLIDSSVTFSGQAVLSEGGKFERWSYNPRLLGPNDVEISISHCGVCASDLHTVSGGWGPCVFPILPGHEIIGTIKKIGSKVKLHQVGDRVGVGPQVLSCLKRDGSCDYCTNHQENLCRTETVMAYNSFYSDGIQSQGGYSTGIRVHEEFVIPIPASLPSDAAAPLLCAGVTVFAPLQRYKVGPGVRVGVVGIGGLGHLAIQFAHKMGAHVTAISSSKKKAEEALSLGANVHIDINNNRETNSVRGKLDVIIATANAKGINWNNYIGLTAPNGTFCVVALPEEGIKIDPFVLVGNQINFAGSNVGSIAEQKSMLSFAAKHNVIAKVEVMEMAQANEAAEKVRKNEVRFRVVLKN